MSEQNKLLTALEIGLDFSSADQTEVVVLERKSQLTRFSNSVIHQNVAEKNVRFSVRVVRDKKIGCASTNRLDERSIEEAVTKAAEVVSFLPPHADFQTLPGPETVPVLKTFSRETASSTPAEKAEIVALVVKEASRHGLTAAGALSTEESSIGVANSLGIKAVQEFTSVDFNTVLLSDDSSGFAAFIGVDINSMDIKKLTAQAISKADTSRNPISLEPGPYTVILEPPAVGEMLGFLGYAGFGALAYQEGRSFMAGKFGQKIAGDNITIWDDGLDPRTMAMPFDYEGVPKQMVRLVENGIARNVVYDSLTAFKEKRKSTGHALPAPNLYGPLPLNLFLQPGDASFEEMVASTEKGILVTRFHYTNLEDPMKTVLTGMTRDGTFLIEKGKIKSGLRNFRFTQNILEALSSVEQISSQSELVSCSIGACYVPALKIANFNFTGVTEF